MKFAVSSVVIGLVALAGTAAVAKPGEGGNAKPEQALLKSLNAIVQNGVNPPGQSKRPNDPDMGDDNAALRAILVVCTKDTPAAQRSAICDRPPVSPA